MRQHIPINSQQEFEDFIIRQPEFMLSKRYYLIDENYLPGRKTPVQAEMRRTDGNSWDESIVFGTTFTKVVLAAWPAIQKPGHSYPQRRNLTLLMLLKKLDPSAVKRVKAAQIKAEQQRREDNRAKYIAEKAAEQVEAARQESPCREVLGAFLEDNNLDYAVNDEQNVVEIRTGDVVIRITAEYEPKK